LDALFDAAPDLIRLVIRRAWERSQNDDDEVKPKPEKAPDTESVADPRMVDEDADLSLWKRGE
ncbi:MAG: hypothetical protein CME19_16155, partial [Gemmatimonadetes bacterium]|nr:hypothetical protein [Gemmatimonadota bacterium]